MLLWAVPSWSDGQIVQPGDQASVHFTCRLKNGDIVASSYPSVAQDPKLRKSTIFVTRRIDTPLSITAGGSYPAPDSNGERGLEGEIVHQLSGAIVGLSVGEWKTREIRAERLQERTKGDYFIQVARVRQRVKEMRFTPEEYKSRTGKAAEVGQSFVLDPAVPGRVSSVTASEVVVRFFAKTGDKVTTPFGEGIIRELPDKYEIVIDARAGGLLRSGGLVGLITSVDDHFISID